MVKSKLMATERHYKFNFIGQTGPDSNYTECNTCTVCLYNTNAYFLQIAAGGERNLESNQFAIDVSCFTLSQRYKNELSATSNLGRRFLPANVSIYILSLNISTHLICCMLYSGFCLQNTERTEYQYMKNIFVLLSVIWYVPLPYHLFLAIFTYK